MANHEQNGAPDLRETRSQATGTSERITRITEEFDGALIFDQDQLDRIGRARDTIDTVEQAAEVLHAIASTDGEPYPGSERRNAPHILRRITKITEITPEERRAAAILLALLNRTRGAAIDRIDPAKRTKAQS